MSERLHPYVPSRTLRSSSANLHIPRTDIDVDEKYERRRGASLLASSILITQGLQYSTSNQFLINYTSTSSSLNFELYQNLANLDLNVFWFTLVSYCSSNSLEFSPFYVHLKP